MISYLSNNMVRVFFIWALDDVRYVDQMVWQHIAPYLYPELQQSLDHIFASLEEQSSEKLMIAIDDAFADFAKDQIVRSPRCGGRHILHTNRGGGFAWRLACFDRDLHQERREQVGLQSDHSRRGRDGRNGGHSVRDHGCVRQPGIQQFGNLDNSRAAATRHQWSRGDDHRRPEGRRRRSQDQLVVV